MVTTLVAIAACIVGCIAGRIVGARLPASMPVQLLAALPASLNPYLLLHHCPHVCCVIDRKAACILVHAVVRAVGLSVV
eukprot:2533300-Alexandrium_andersonii.AAC.1